MAKADLVDLGLIEDLSNAYGVSGFEDLVLEVARKHATGLAEISEDSIRNLYLRRPGDTGKRPVVMEHEISAFYDITHGLGLAILTPRWMKYTLDETTVSKFYQFGCNVFGIDRSLAPMEVAKKSIEMLSDFLYSTLGLKKSLTELGIDDSNFAVMAKKASMGGTQHAFKPLRQEDIERIFRACL